MADSHVDLIGVGTEACQAKIADFWGVAGVEEDISGFYIDVDQGFVV